MKLPFWKKVLLWAAGAVSVFLGLDLAALGDFKKNFGAWVKHGWERFAWGFLFFSVYRLVDLYGFWLHQLSSAGWFFACGWLAAFCVFLRVFFPTTWIFLHPGKRIYFCPQCFNKEEMSFFPLHPGLAFFGTWLCPNCSALVNRIGEQEGYPRKDWGEDLGRSASWTFLVTSTAVVLGAFFAVFFWRWVGMAFFL